MKNVAIAALVLYAFSYAPDENDVQSIDSTFPPWFLVQEDPEPTKMLWSNEPYSTEVSSFYPDAFRSHMRPEIWCTGAKNSGSLCVKLARKWDCGFGANADTHSSSIEGYATVLDDDNLPITPERRIQGRRYRSPFLHEEFGPINCCYSDRENQRKCAKALRRMAVCHFLQFGEIDNACHVVCGYYSYSHTPPGYEVSKMDLNKGDGITHEVCLPWVPPTMDW